MSSSKILQYEALPRQLEFLALCDQIPHPAYIGGFGSGKSHVLCLQALREVQVMGSFGLLGANTYRLLADSTQRTFFKLCPTSWIRSFIKSENKVIFRNGSEIIFRALEHPERLTNLELDWFGLDEVGYVKEDTFKMLQSRIRTAGSRHGFVVGNPSGPAHWTYEYFVVKAKQLSQLFRLITAPTDENVFLPKSYLQSMTLSYGPESPYYKRFVLGQFVAFEGAIWPDFNPLPYDEGGHVLRYADQLFAPFSSRDNLRFGRSIDFGFEHPFVCMWYVTDGKTIVFYDEHWKRHITLQEHAELMHFKDREHQKDWKIPKHQWAWTDHDATIRNELESLEGDLKITCTPADKEVMAGILLVQSLMRQKRLFITDRCEHAYREIMSYRMKPIEKSTKEQPIKEADDTCDAIRMASMMEIDMAAQFKRSSAVKYDLPIDGLNNYETISDDLILSVH